MPQWPLVNFNDKQLDNQNNNIINMPQTHSLLPLEPSPFISLLLPLLINFLFWWNHLPFSPSLLLPWYHPRTIWLFSIFFSSCWTFSFSPWSSSLLLLLHFQIPPIIIKVARERKRTMHIYSRRVLSSYSERIEKRPRNGQLTNVHVNVAAYARVFGYISNFAQNLVGNFWIFRENMKC